MKKKIYASIGLTMEAFFCAFTQKLNCTFRDGAVIFTLDNLSLYVAGQDNKWQNPFTDVEEGSWYYTAVGFITERGITTGTSPTTFSPDEALTRGQFITLLMRAYNIAPVENPAENFSDAGDRYYTGYLAAAKRLGISNGVGDNRFAPEQEITRRRCSRFFTMRSSS